MSTPAVVWLVVALLTTTVVVAMVIGLVRHLIVLYRSIGRFGQEVGPVVQDLSDQAARGAERTRPQPGGRR